MNNLEEIITNPRGILLFESRRERQAERGCRSRELGASAALFRSSIQSSTSDKSKGEINLKCMIFVKATKDSEKGTTPGPELLTAMGKYNEELFKAGIMKGGGGLKPTSHSKRVRFSGAQRTVLEGPFVPTEEQVAGYWLWEVKSMDEAIEWLKRCPNPMLVDSDIEIRPEFEAADFAG